MRKYSKGYKALPILRAIGVLSAVSVITTMVTFAAIQSTGNALTGNTIETATAALQISTDGINFKDNAPGYDFNSIVPGGGAQPSGIGYLVSLKNTGSTSLKLSLAVPTNPVMTGVVDPSEVNILLDPPSSNGITYPGQTFKLSELMAGKVPLTGIISTLGIHAQENLYLHVSMAADAVNGGGATITGLDLSFSGVPQ